MTAIHAAGAADPDTNAEASTEARTEVGSAVISDDDFWLLLDYELPPQNALWLYGGADEFDGSYFGVSTDLAITEALYFNFAVTEQHYSVETTDLRWGFSGAIDPYFSWAIWHTFWGKRDELEKNDTGLSLSWLEQRFNVSIGFERGQLELFLRDIPQIERESIDSEHQAYELLSGYSWDTIFTQLTLKRHHYEKDLTLLQRPRLFRVLNPVGIQQASALADREASILLGMLHEDMQYEIIFSRIRSAVTEDWNSYLTAHLSKSLTSSLTLRTDIELPINDVPFSIGLAVGILW